MKGTHRWRKVTDGYRCRFCGVTKRVRRDKVTVLCTTEGRSKERYGLK